MFLHRTQANINTKANKPEKMSFMVTERATLTPKLYFYGSPAAIHSTCQRLNGLEARKSEQGLLVGGAFVSMEVIMKIITDFVIYQQEGIQIG